MGFIILLAFVAVLGVNTAEAVKCLQCVDMPHPFDCNVVTECTSVEECYVEQFITSSGITLYNSGCLSKHRCKQSKRDLAAGHVVKRQDELVSKTDLVTCIECCPDEFCNIQGCYETAPPRTIRGPKCFDCNAQESPEHCRDTFNCDLDQVCAILHDHPYDKEWTSKCMGKIQCHALVRFQMAHLIGKRDTINVKSCPRCCEDDFCNDDCGHNVTYVPTTHAPTNPPTTHAPKTTTHKPTTHAPKVTTHKPATHAPKVTTHKPVTHAPKVTTHKPVTHAPKVTPKPTTHKPTTHKKVTHAHTTSKPTTHKPITHKPTTHKPTTHKKVTHAPHTTPKPTTAKPTTHKPRTHKPTTAKPTTHKPTTAKPTTQPPPTTTPHLVTTTDPKIACEGDGYIYDRPTKMCLKFILTKRNWTDAQSDCGKQGGRLVVMTSDAKTRDVNHYLAAQAKYKTVKFWVGATEISHVHTFTWTNGKTVVVDDYMKYDLTKTNCLLTANPKPAIVYDPCKELNSYICENSNYIRAKK